MDFTVRNEFEQCFFVDRQPYLWNGQPSVMGQKLNIQTKIVSTKMSISWRPPESRMQPPFKINNILECQTESVGNQFQRIIEEKKK